MDLESRKKFLKEDIQELTEHQNRIPGIVYSVVKTLTGLRNDIYTLRGDCRKHDIVPNDTSMDEFEMFELVDGLIGFADKTDQICEYHRETTERTLDELENPETRPEEKQEDTETDSGETCLQLVAVADDSMSPYYRIGDVLLVQPLNNPTFFQYGEVHVIDGTFIRRINPDPDDEENIMLFADNNYPPVKVAKNAIQSIGIVVGSARGGVLIEHLKKQIGK